VKCIAGIWFPDAEMHLQTVFGPNIDGKATYQYHKLEAALRHVKQWRCAVDVGMHVGLWAMHLAKRFDQVIGFEPVAEHIDCLRLNMAAAPNYVVREMALGHRAGSVGLKILPGSTGSTQIDEEGQGIEMRTLDSFDFTVVDFLKIDVENYEYFVVEGGEQTIRRCKPIIVIEQKGDKTRKHKSTYGRERHDAKELLEAWGAKQLFEMNGDHCMGWN